MRQSRLQIFSRHPVRIGNLLWSYIMTLFFCKNNFAIGAADGSKANQGVMEGGNDSAGLGGVGG